METTVVVFMEGKRLTGEEGQPLTIEYRKHEGTIVLKVGSSSIELNACKALDLIKPILKVAGIEINGIPYPPESSLQNAALGQEMLAPPRQLDGL